MLKLSVMESRGMRWILFFASVLSFILGAALVVFFVFICMEGIINNFAYFGILANFNDVLGVIALLCLIFGLVCILFSISQFKLARANPRRYLHRRVGLIISLIVYFGLMAVSAFCIFETYNDLSSVGAAFNVSNIGYISIALLVVSFLAFILVLADMIVFNHDVKIGAISLTELSPQLLLAAPNGIRKAYDQTNQNMTRLNEQIAKLNKMKEEGLIDDAEFKAYKKNLIDNFFD